MLHSNIRREIAAQYHKNLPDEVRSYLKGRGIPSTIVEKELLGWSDERIVIPVFGHEREVLGFRYTKLPTEPTDNPEIVSDIQLGTQLYGLDRLLTRPRRIVICEGEFDRLVLEANGIAAATSTAGAATFLEEWLPDFEPVKHVYICFRRNLAGIAAAKKIQQLLPREGVLHLCRRAVVLVRDGCRGCGTGGLRPVALAGFDHVHERAELEHEEPGDHPRRAVAFVRFVIKLPLGHGAQDEREASFAVYPENDTYACSGCGPTTSNVPSGYTRWFRTSRSSKTGLYLVIMESTPTGCA